MCIVTEAISVFATFKCNAVFEFMRDLIGLFRLCLLITVGNFDAVRLCIINIRCLRGNNTPMCYYVLFIFVLFVCCNEYYEHYMNITNLILLQPFLFVDIVIQSKVIIFQIYVILCSLTSCFYLQFTCFLVLHFLQVLLFPWSL